MFRSFSVEFIYIRRNSLIVSKNHSSPSFCERITKMVSWVVINSTKTILTERNSKCSKLFDSFNAIYYTCQFYMQVVCLDSSVLHIRTFLSSNHFGLTAGTKIIRFIANFGIEWELFANDVMDLKCWSNKVCAWIQWHFRMCSMLSWHTIHNSQFTKVANACITIKIEVWKIANVSNHISVASFRFVASSFVNCVSDYTVCCTCQRRTFIRLLIFICEMIIIVASNKKLAVILGFLFNHFFQADSQNHWEVVRIDCCIRLDYVRCITIIWKII